MLQKRLQPTDEAPIDEDIVAREDEVDEVDEEPPGAGAGPDVEAAASSPSLCSLVKTSSSPGRPSRLGAPTFLMRKFQNTEDSDGV